MDGLVDVSGKSRRDKKSVLSVCTTGPHPGDLSPVPVLPIH